MSTRTPNRPAPSDDWPNLRDQLESRGFEFTPNEFCWALITMDEESVNNFLAAGMAPDAVVQEQTGEDSGITAVHVAAASSNAACLRQLLLFGADPTSSSCDGQGQSMPTLAFAASRLPKDEHALLVLHLLIEAGCDPSSIADCGGYQQATAVYAINNVLLLDALLTAGANPEIGTIEPPSSERKTLLMLAVLQGQFASCQKILDAGADINAQSADGGIDKVTELLDQGNVPERSHLRTPLEDARLSAGDSAKRAQGPDR